MTERRHGPSLAIGEAFLEFFFRGKFNLVRAGDFAQILQNDLAVGRQDSHGHLAIEFDNAGITPATGVQVSDEDDLLAGADPDVDLSWLDDA